MPYGVYVVGLHSGVFGLEAQATDNSLPISMLPKININIHVILAMVKTKIKMYMVIGLCVLINRPRTKHHKLIDPLVLGFIQSQWCLIEVDGTNSTDNTMFSSKT